MNEQQQQQPPASSRSRFRFPTSFRSNSKINKDTVPPLSANRPAFHKPPSTTSLQRTPSAPVYPRLHTPLSNRDSHPHSHFRTRSNTAYGSSTSSIDRISAAPSPILPGSESSLPTFSPFADSQHSHPSASSQSSKDEDLNTAPAELHRIAQSSKSFTSDFKTSSAPPLLHHTHTSPDPRGLHLLRSPPLSSRTMEVTPPRSDHGATSPKRHSDDSSSGKPSLSGRKKSGFSSFVNSMLGSPRNIKISAPENPIHMIHVGYDNVTGQFTVSLKPPAGPVAPRSSSREEDRSRWPHLAHTFTSRR